MKKQLTFFTLSITLLSGCYHTRIQDGVDTYSSCGKDEKTVVYTNTSRSKYLEVTIKDTYSDGSYKTKTKRLKPGEITRSCAKTTTILSVVGEREINDND